MFKRIRKAVFSQARKIIQLDINLSFEYIACPKADHSKNNAIKVKMSVDFNLLKKISLVSMFYINLFRILFLSSEYFTLHTLQLYHAALYIASPYGCLVLSFIVIYLCVYLNHFITMHACTNKYTMFKIHNNHRTTKRRLHLISHFITSCRQQISGSFSTRGSSILHRIMHKFPMHPVW